MVAPQLFSGAGAPCTARAAVLALLVLGAMDGLQPAASSSSAQQLLSAGEFGDTTETSLDGATAADVTDVTMTLLPGVSVDPYYFGYCLESYVGITMGLPLNDTAVVAVAKALHTGVLRFPGGTLSNLFDARTGRYVLPAPAEMFPAGYPSGYDKWIPWGELTNKLPLGEYSARNYLQGLGSVPKRTIWCINVYSLNASEACSQVEYIASLPQQQAPGVIVEFGNEVYIGNQGDPRFPNGKIYMQQVQEVVACARKLMPSAKLIAVGAPGGWNQALRSSGLLHTFDGVSLHEYEPSGQAVNATAKALADRVSLVAGWGRAVMAKDVKQLRADLGDSNHSIIYTEFGYGLNHAGQCVLPALLNGALHGAFHVSRILHAINTPGAFAAITLESFIGGRPEGYDPQAGGNRSDYWCGLAATTLDCPINATGGPHCRPNDPAGARVTGEAQIFAHLAAAAGMGGPSEATTLMHGVAVQGGPTLPFQILGEAQPCLQAAAFSSASPAAASIATLNICNHSIVASVKTADGRLATTVSATFYSLLDGGTNGGWAPLPAADKVDVFPWTSGPLRPTTDNTLRLDGGSGDVRLTFPPLVFAMVEIKTDDENAAAAAADPALVPTPNNLQHYDEGEIRGGPDKRRLLFMDCDPPAQRGWASTCSQEDVAVTAEPGLNSSCSAMEQENPDWIVCAGERLVAVHKTWGMPGLLSIGSLWGKPCDTPKTCGCPAAPGTTTPAPCGPYAAALPANWGQTLGKALKALRPAFLNGSIEGVALGDELAADGVPVSNLSSVATFIKTALAGSGAYVTTNEDSTSFGGPLHGPQFHYPGSFADYGSVPAAIDFISIDEYTEGKCCFNTTGGQPDLCGYEINPVDCVMRECEADHVMAFYYLKVFPLLKAPHQRAWIVPGLFGNDSPGSLAGDLAHQEDMLLQQLEGYWTWMQNEPRIVGMWPWHWWYRAMPGTPYSLGIKNFTRLTARLREIGGQLAAE
jgi:hypothetical protein